MLVLERYPDLRFVQNSAAEYTRSLERITAVLDKMSTRMPVTARHAVFSLHTVPENYYTPLQTIADFHTTVQTLDAVASKLNITLSLRVGVAKPPQSLTEAVGYVAKTNSWKVALSTAVLAHHGITTAAALNAELKVLGQDSSCIGLWYVGAGVYDPLAPSTLISESGTLSRNKTAAATAVALMSAAPVATAVLEAASGSRAIRAQASFADRINLEYREAASLERARNS